MKDSQKPEGQVEGYPKKKESAAEGENLPGKINTSF